MAKGPGNPTFHTPHRGQQQQPVSIWRCWSVGEAGEAPVTMDRASCGLVRINGSPWLACSVGDGEDRASHRSELGIFSRVQQCVPCSTDAMEVGVYRSKGGLAELTVDGPGVDAGIAQAPLHGLPEFFAPGMGALGHLLVGKLEAVVERLHHELGGLFWVFSRDAIANLQHPSKIVHGYRVAQCRGFPEVLGPGGVILCDTLALDEEEAKAGHAVRVAFVGSLPK